MAAEEDGAHFVAWECDDCAATNQGNAPGPCFSCSTDSLVRYMVFKNLTGVTALTAQTHNEDWYAQVLLSRTAHATTLTIADTTSHSNMVRMLMNTVVDIIGVNKENRG